MVVLSAAVCTKAGKVLVARQFLPMPKLRIEGLLAAFPKLIGAEVQHTFIENENVRYVYQPIESLYVMLITNKSSNIIEDLETLRLLVKLVPEHCGGTSEEAVASHAFELVFAFDEVISVGYRENVTTAQVKTFTEMDSHEEKLAKIIMESKVHEARENAKRKAESIDKQKADARRAMGPAGGSSGSYGGHGGGSFDSGEQRYSGAPGGARETEKEEKRDTKKKPTKEKEKDSWGKAETGGAAKPIKGMQLSKKKQQDDFVSALAKETVAQNVAAPAAAAGLLGDSGAAPAEHKDNVHVTIEEKLVISLERDGALKKLEIKGDMTICISDPDQARILVHTTGPLKKKDGFQARLNPKIDSAGWDKNGVIGLKESGKPFPVGSDNAPSVLKWRLTSTQEELVPLSVNVWPNNEDGHTVVSAEVRAAREGFVLKKVYITIPCDSDEPPEVTQIDGDHTYSQKDKTLNWLIEEISDSSPNANLEFRVSEMDGDAFFPIIINFTSENTYSNFQVSDITLVDNNEAVPYTQSVSLKTEDFRVE